MSIYFCKNCGHCRSEGGQILKLKPVASRLAGYVKYVLISLFVGAVSVSCTYQQLPPYKAEMIDHFHEQKQAMAVLESKLLETKYDNVRRAFSDALADYWHGDEYLAETPEGAVEWNQMLNAAGVNSVNRSGDGSIVFPLSVRFGENVTGGVGYVHSQSAEPGLQECRDDFATIPCGRCAVRLEEGWWINVYWYTNDLDNEVRAQAWKVYQEGLIDLREYMESGDEIYEACFTEGNRLIGNSRPE